MWSPTHIQVTVQKARGLLTKGKNGTNNCFVTIGLGKEKYQTSVKDKVTQSVEWHEECELKIPDKGNRAELVLTCLHRNNLGLDEFLGQVTLPLNEMDAYDRPRSKWFTLESKPGKEKKKERGELEVKIAFNVKCGSLTDLSKKEKHKSSIGLLASTVGGSLLSIGTIEKRKGIKKFAKSIGSKMHLSSKKKNKDGTEGDGDSVNGSFASIDTSNNNVQRYGQRLGDADPGVISEDEDELVFDDISHKSSGSSLNVRPVKTRHFITTSPLFPNEESVTQIYVTPPSKPPRNQSDNTIDEWETKLYGKHLDVGSTDSLKRRSWENSKIPLPGNNLNSSSEHDNNSKETSVSTDNSPILRKSVSEFQIQEETYPSTAPTSPVFIPKSKENLSVNNVFNDQDSKPITRSLTMDCLSEKSQPTSPVKEIITPKEKSEKKQRFSKFRYFKRDRHDSVEELGSNSRLNERIIIGREKSAGPGQEVSAALSKKYEGKSREELMFLANGLEHEAIIQRQRVKELEDYLDNLLLRVMETHPKILQNPYCRIASTKNG